MQEQPREIGGRKGLQRLADQRRDAGPGAGEQIALWSMMLANRMKLGALAATVLPYPTLAELSKRAASSYFSPKLFDNALIKRVVRAVQRWVP